MHAETGRRRHEPAARLRELVAAGTLGRKTGRGFYPYERVGSGTRTDQPADGKDDAAPKEIVETLLYPHLDDAIWMRDSGYASATDIDNAMKFGCGYPKGPFELIEEMGNDTLRAQQRGFAGRRRRRARALATPIASPPARLVPVPPLGDPRFATGSVSAGQTTMCGVAGQIS
jgi:3-hydroxyacyl-CoA dehydrogenase